MKSAVLAAAALAGCSGAPGPGGASAERPESAEAEGPERPERQERPERPDRPQAAAPQTALLTPGERSERAWIARCGRASIRRGDLDRPENACADPSEEIGEVVVDRSEGEAVRVIDRFGSVRYAIYVRRADLAERVVDSTRIRPDPGSDVRGARAVGGAPVEIRAREGDWIEVRISEHGVEVTGWIPAARLGRMYRAAEPATFGDGLKLHRDLEVRARPGGPVIARVSSGDFRRHARAVGARGGYLEMEVATRWLRVRGFVPEAAVSTREPVKWGSGGGEGWGASHTRFLSVPARTTLHESPGGETVALTLHDHATLALAGERKGAWVAVRFQTHWHQATAWVRCPALERAGVGRDRRCAGE